MTSTDVIAQMNADMFGTPYPDHDNPAPDANGGPEIDIGRQPEPVAPQIEIKVETAEIMGPSKAYSISDLALFRALTGYRLGLFGVIVRAVDDEGKRVAIADRLFTTLAEEAFRVADMTRRNGRSPETDLTPGDVAETLPVIRRAAGAIGSRGLAAFDRLEAAAGELAGRPRAAVAET